MNRFYGKDYPNRTMCAVLDEMRECNKTRNFAPLLGLIEEIQIMGNKMEAGLSDKHDLEEMKEQRSIMNKELKKLQAKIDELKKKTGDDEKASD